jgi:hypothetical protein
VNRRSLGFARDDKGDGGGSIRSNCLGGDVFFQQPLPVEWSTFPLSSRAKSRDLRFNGPLVEMFCRGILLFPIPASHLPGGQK